jgi:hypothetical protein
MNEANMDRVNKELVMRDSTDDVDLETSYCQTCKTSDYRNIGKYTCHAGHTK